MGADRTERGVSGASAATPRRRALFAVAAMALGFVASVAVLEAGLRAFTPAWLAQRMGELNAGEPSGRAQIEAGRSSSKTRLSASSFPAPRSPCATPNTGTP